MREQLRRRPLIRWTLFLLSVEKAIQHCFVTWAFAANRFELRDQVAVPWEWLMLSGGVIAALFACAAIGLWQDRPGTPKLLAALAMFDIVGEFVAQGTILIDLIVSFIVAVVILALALRMVGQRSSP